MKNINLLDNFDCFSKYIIYSSIIFIPIYFIFFYKKGNMENEIKKLKPIILIILGISFIYIVFIKKDDYLLEFFSNIKSI